MTEENGTTGTKSNGSATVAEAEQHKNEGNEAFKAKKFQQAIDCYSRAISIDDNNAIYFSNRALAHIHLENYGAALQDATSAIRIDPTFVKAYYRRGTAYLALTKYKKALSDFRQVLRISPGDRVCREKSAQCQREIRREMFEAAIASEQTELASETVRKTLESIVVEDTYDGPRLSSEDGYSVTMQFVHEMMGRLKEQKKLHRKYVLLLLLQLKDQLQQLKSLYHVDIPHGRHLTVCGDTHGQFYDLCNIFEINGLPSSDNPYLFNGDYVDRGSFSVEVALTLFAFKVADPQCIHLTRGNHESRHLNRAYGFEGEVKHKYNEQMFEIFLEVFHWLPLAVVLNRRVLVLHGGIGFKEDGVKLEDIEKIDRNRDIPDEGLMSDILWSDPMKENGRMPSKRGVSISFGPDVTKRFLDDNNLDLLVRSHEVKQDGFELEADGRCITIFSAPNYVDQVGNKGAFIIFRNESEDGPLSTEIKQFDCVPHPPIKPMAYASQLFNQV